MADGTLVRPPRATAGAERVRPAPARLVRTAFAGWERFFFGEASLVRLALFRVVMLCAAFDGAWNVRPALLQHATGVRETYLERGWKPIYAFELLGLGPPAEHTHAVWIALVVALALGIVGLFTRTACAAAAVLVFYWIGSEYSFGKPHHTCVALVLGLFALPFGPVGARLSLDSALKRRRTARRGATALPVSERAPWAALPLRFTQLTLAIGYFFSGATKLAVSGLAWANGYTLMAIMAENPAPWSGFFVERRALLVLVSLVLLFGQACFPLAVVVPRLAWVFVPLMAVFHFVAMQTMATGPFLTLVLALSAFVALERVPGFLARNVGAGPWWRRALAASAFVALAWLFVALYCANKPGWFPWLFAPFGTWLVLAAFRARAVTDGPAARAA